MKTLKDTVKESIILETGSRYEHIVELANELKQYLKQDMDELKASDSSYAKEEHDKYVKKFFDQVNFISKYYNNDEEE